MRPARRRTLPPLALAAACLAVPAFAAAPSFDCARAEHEVETLICADDGLAALDREVARLYALARGGADAAETRELTAEQRGWIKGRNDCWKAGPGAAEKIACAADASMVRILELREAYPDARREVEGALSGGPLSVVCEGWPTPMAFVWTYAEPGMAAIGWDGRSLALDQAIAASGVRYLGRGWDGDYELWTKGDDAMLTLPGRAPLTCRLEEIAR